MRSIVGVVKINAKTESIAIKASVLLALHATHQRYCVQTKMEESYVLIHLVMRRAVLHAKKTLARSATMAKNA